MSLQATASVPSWWVFPLVLIAVPGFWLALMFVIAHVGGWAGLARAFPAPGRPRGVTFRSLSLQIRPATSYGGCITAVFGPDGLFLVPFLIFRFGHRPLLIPWEDVGAPVERRFLGFRLVHLPINTPVRAARLGLSRQACRWLQSAASREDWRPSLAPLEPADQRSSAFKRDSTWRGR